MRRSIRIIVITRIRVRTRKDGAMKKCGRTEDEHERRTRWREQEEAKRSKIRGTKKGRTPPNWAMQRAEKRKRKRRCWERKAESNKRTTEQKTRRENPQVKNGGESKKRTFLRLSIYDLSLFYFRNFLTQEGHYVSSSSSSSSSASSASSCSRSMSVC